jgi:hypothetical protein
VAFYDGFVGRTCVPLFMIGSAFLPVPIAGPVIAVLTVLCCAVTTNRSSRIPGSKWVIGCWLGAWSGKRDKIIFAIFAIS